MMRSHPSGTPTGRGLSRRRLAGAAAVGCLALLGACSEDGSSSQGSKAPSPMPSSTFIEIGSAPLVLARFTETDGELSQPTEGFSITVPRKAGTLSPLGDTTSAAFVYKSQTEFSALQVMIDHPNFDDHTTPEWWARWEWGKLENDPKARSVSGMAAVDWPGGKDGKAYTWTWTQYLDASVLDPSAAGAVTMDAVALMVGSEAGGGLHVMAGAPSGTLPKSEGLKALQSVKVS